MMNRFIRSECSLKFNHTIRSMLLYKTIISQQIIILVLTIFLFGCADKNKETDRVFKTLNEGLISSNKLIENENNIIYVKMDENLNNPISHNKTIIWQPKVTLIRQQSRSIKNFIDSLSNLVNSQIVDLKEGNCNILFDKLFNYKNTLLGVDTEIQNHFKDCINIVATSHRSLDSSRVDFYQTFFVKKSKTSVVTVLNNLKNNVLQTENMLVNFCFSSIAIDHPVFDKFSVIVGQSASIIEQGDEIEITTGIGAFSSVASLKVYIQGKQIKANENAVAVYKFKAIGNPGKYSIPVRIDYLDINGKKLSKVIDIDYKIKK